MSAYVCDHLACYAEDATDLCEEMCVDIAGDLPYSVCDAVCVLVL